MAKVAKAYPDSLVDFVDKALDDADPGVRGAAVEMLANKGFYSPDIVPTALKAMNDKEPSVRQKALDACIKVTDPAVNDVLIAALNDEKEDIRTAAIQMTAQKKMDIRLPVLEAGLASQYEDVRAGSATELMNTASKEAVDSLLPYLNDSKPEFRDTIQSMIKSLVGQEFDTYEQGKAWWDSNRDKLGNDLKPIDPNHK
jgi:hypothetical protein